MLVENGDTTQKKTDKEFILVCFSIDILGIKYLYSLMD